MYRCKLIKKDDADSKWPESRTDELQLLVLVIKTWLVPLKRLEMNPKR